MTGPVNGDAPKAPPVVVTDQKSAESKNAQSTSNQKNQSRGAGIAWAAACIIASLAAAILLAGGVTACVMGGMVMVATGAFAAAGVVQICTGFVMGAVAFQLVLTAIDSFRNSRKHLSSTEGSEEQNIQVQPSN